MKRGERSERTRAMVAEYVGGDSLLQVARRHGVSKAAVSFALDRCGARLSPDETAARLRAHHVSRGAG